MFYCSSPTDVRRTLLDISKAFDKVWHEVLTFIAKAFGDIDGNLKLLSPSPTRSCLKWVNFSMAKHFGRCTTGACCRALFICNLH